MKRILIAAIVTLSLTAQAAETNFLCEGTMDTSLDGKHAYRDIKVDAIVSPDAATLTLDGAWGCMSDYGDLGGQEPSKFRCLEALPVKVTSEALTYSFRADGPLYSSNTRAALNRYSATLTISSAAIAKPAANAAWRLMLITGKLSCKNLQKQF